MKVTFTVSCLMNDKGWAGLVIMSCISGSGPASAHTLPPPPSQGKVWSNVDMDHLEHNLKNSLSSSKDIISISLFIISPSCAKRKLGSKRGKWLQNPATCSVALLAAVPNRSFYMCTRYVVDAESCLLIAAVVSKNRSYTR